MSKTKERESNMWEIQPILTNQNISKGKVLITQDIPSLRMFKRVAKKKECLNGYLCPLNPAHISHCTFK